MPYAQNSAACPMTVRHLSGSAMAIPTASAGVLPPRPTCGRMKLWYMISRCSRDLASGCQGVYRIRNTQQAEKNQLHTKANTTDTGQPRMASSLPPATDMSRLADPTSHSYHWRPSLGENRQVPARDQIPLHSDIGMRITKNVASNPVQQMTSHAWARTTTDISIHVTPEPPPIRPSRVCSKPLVPNRPRRHISYI